MAADKILNCVECGLAFVFSGDEQQRHAQRGFDKEPRRCPPCRADARQRRKNQEETARRKAAPPAPVQGPIRACASCGVEVMLDAPRPPGVPILCDACRR